MRLGSVCCVTGSCEESQSAVDSSANMNTCQGISSSAAGGVGRRGGIWAGSLCVGLNFSSLSSLFFKYLKCM